MDNSLIRISSVRFDWLQNWNIGNLIAPFWRLYWNPEPGSSVTCAKERTNLEPDHYYLIPAHTPYSARSKKAHLHFYIHFYLEWNFPDRQAMAFKVDRLMRNHVQRITNLCRTESSAPVEAEKLLIGHTMIFHALSKIPFDRFRMSTSDLAMEKAIELMLDHVQTGIHVDRLADQVGMSRSTFMREFKSRFNISPAKYLILQRVEMAASLLGTSEDSIEEIAALTGFYDRYHMTKVFQRLRGLTPAAHRREVQSRRADPNQQD